MSTRPTTASGEPDTMKGQAKASADKAAGALRSGAHDVAETVSTEASNYATQAKDTAADEVKGVASALRTAADEMRSGSPQERTFSQIADGLADASEAMRDKDLGEIVNDLNGFAKRNPLVFLGSAALIGFAATRFAKATGRGTADRDFDRPAPAPRDHSSHPATSPRPAAPSIATGETS